MIDDRKWADHELTTKTAKELADYLSMTPATASEIAACCSDVNLFKVFEFLLESVKDHPLETAVDLIGPVIMGLSSRFREEGRLPDEVVEQLIASIRRHYGYGVGAASGGVV